MPRWSSLRRCGSDVEKVRWCGAVELLEAVEDGVVVLGPAASESDDEGTGSVECDEVGRRRSVVGRCVLACVEEGDTDGIGGGASCGWAGSWGAQMFKTNEG